MNDDAIHDLLVQAYDAVPAAAFDPADDVRRGRAARVRRRAVRTAVGGTALVVAACVAVALLPGRAAPEHLIGPAGAGGPNPTAATSAVPTVVAPTPTASSATSSATSGSSQTTQELGTRMYLALQANLANSDRYLSSWGDGHGGVESGSSGGDVNRFGIHVEWAQPGSRRIGGIRVVSAAPGDDRELLCGRDRNDLPASACRVVSRDGGTKVYYGSTDGVRAASVQYADGRRVTVVADSLMAGNSLRPTTVPLPTKDELVAVATDPGLAWPAEVVEAGEWWGAPRLPPIAGGPTSPTP